MRNPLTLSLKRYAILWYNGLRFMARSWSTVWALRNNPQILISINYDFRKAKEVPRAKSPRRDKPDTGSDTSKPRRRKRDPQSPAL